MNLFYAAPMLLAPESVVLPGNWYRMLRRYGEQHSFFLPFRELVYEEIRKTEFPATVSRLDCVFCCETEEGLLGFMQHEGRPFDEMYEVELVDKDPVIFRADWSIVKGISGQRVWDQAEAQARTYWSTTPTHNVEVLSASPVRIIRHIPS
jgi:hypothetical protein